MIQLHKDLFARLSISAKSLREERIETSAQKPENAKGYMPQSKSGIILKPVVSNDINSFLSMNSQFTKQKPVEKMEDKIQHEVDNPELKALREEIAYAESVFNNIKSEESNPSIILRLEQKIAALKGLAEQKKYI